MSCFRLIAEFYGERCVKRSGVRLIEHIIEGLIILKEIGASQDAQDGFCLHPLVQEDSELSSTYNGSLFDGVGSRPILLAMEYRAIANAHLSFVSESSPIQLSILSDVNDMLIADKVQNKKDFLKYHYGKHSRSKELLAYFNRWLVALSISEERYAQLVEKLNSRSS